VKRSPAPVFAVTRLRFPFFHSGFIVSPVSGAHCDLGIGTLSLGAIARDHFILTAKDGFPDLPPVHLTLMYRSQGAVFDQFADVLRSLVALKTGMRTDLSVPSRI